MSAFVLGYLHLWFAYVVFVLGYGHGSNLLLSSSRNTRVRPSGIWKRVSGHHRATSRRDTRSFTATTIWLTVLCIRYSGHLQLRLALDCMRRPIYFLLLSCLDNMRTLCLPVYIIEL